MTAITLHRRLRRTMPYLTPPWAGDNAPAYNDMLYRTRLPRGLESLPSDDDGLRIPPLLPPATEPEFGEPYGGIPTLRRPPIHDIDRIAALGEENALPTTEADIPLLSRPIEMPVQPRPPSVIHSEGRPTPIVFGTDDPEQQVLARRRALEAYQPQKESKKSLTLRAIADFVRGGIPGAVGTLIGPAGVLDRRGKDRAWQQQQLGQVYGQLDRTRADRRAGLQDRLLESQIAENNAQAQRTSQRPPPLLRGRIAGKDEFPGIEAGAEIRQEFDPTTGQMKDVLVGGKPVVTKPAPRPRASSGTPHPSTRIVAAGEFPDIPEGTEIRTLWDGKEYVDQIRGGKPIIATTKPFSQTGEDSPKDRAERQRKFGAAQRKLGSLIAQENNAAAEKDKAAAEVGRIQSQLNQLTDESDPARKEALRQQLSIAQSNFERAQGFYASFGEKKAAAQMEMDENVDTEPPRLTRGSVSPPSTFLAAFKKKHGRAPTQAEIEAYAQAANAR